MTEFGIGEALQHLIDTLQIEGHALFEIFVEVQFALAVQYFLYVIGVAVGTILGLYVGYKLSPKVIKLYDVSNRDEPIINSTMLICSVVALIILSLLVIDGITNLYLHYQYPQYYAAKELIESIASIN